MSSSANGVRTVRIKPAMHRTILAVDVEGFGARRRTNRHQLAVRQALYEALSQAFKRSAVDWDDCYREDRGDGVLVMVSPDVPKYLLATSVVDELAGTLREHNRSCAPEERIRLRCALHAGEVHQDDHGVASVAVNLTFRLLAAEPLKSALTHSPGSLALIVSSWFYDEVVRHDPAGEAARYRRVRVTVKETEVTAWVGLPDHPYPPEQQNVPRQLPNAVAGFVGRGAELAGLTALLSEPTGVVMICTITGTAGVGKTSLAVQWAHQVSERFPDGQLYVNLHGYEAGPALTPGQALDGFLRALEIPDDRRPTELDYQAAMFRTVVAGKRMLVLLDNVRSAEQIRPLLPGSAGCLVVITSRNLLSGLVARDGAHRISLDALPLSDAVALLEKSIGRQRAGAEPDAVTELAKLCARLPLALRVAGERAVARPHIMLADLVDELSNEHDRLDVLAVADDEAGACRAVFSWSYHHLSPDAARMFRLLGLHTGPDISIPAAAALAAVDHNQARRLFEALTSAHLLEESARARYRFHNLLRVYAAECVRPADNPDAAIRRLLDWYAHTAANADRVCIVPHLSPTLDPLGRFCAPLSFTVQADALAWYDTEHANLLAAIQQAADRGELDIAWKLPVLMWTFFYIRKNWSVWLSSHHIGLAAAGQVPDVPGRAWLLMLLGLAYRDMRRYEMAIDHLRQALVIWRRTGFQWGQGMCLHNIGKTYLAMRRFDDAISHFRTCVRLCQEIGELSGQALVLGSLCEAYRRLGRFTDALQYGRQALATFRRVGGENRFGEGQALHDVAAVLLELGRHEDAVDHFEQALLVRREIEDRQGEAQTLHSIGDAWYAVGQVVAAHASWLRSLEILEELGDPQAAEVRDRLNLW